MSHHVGVRLPDGRDLLADYRQPVVHIMRRHLRRITDDPGNTKGRGPGCPADLADMALLAEAADHTPDIFCTLTGPPPVWKCAHGPAEPDDYDPPPYRRPVLDGLW